MNETNKWSKNGPYSTTNPIKDEDGSVVIIYSNQFKGMKGGFDNLERLSEQELYILNEVLSNPIYEEQIMKMIKKTNLIKKLQGRT